MISASVIEEINRKAKSSSSSCSGVDKKCSSDVADVRRQHCRRVDRFCGQNASSSSTSSCVEELWSRGRKLEWKRSSRLVQSFTCESEILEALWVDFQPSLSCIVMREAERLIVYAETGEEFLVSREPISLRLFRVEQLLYTEN